MSTTSTLDRAPDAIAAIGARLLFRFARQSGQEIDPLAVRRTLRENLSHGATQRRGDLVDRIVEAGRAHGVCLRAIDWPVDRTSELVQAFPAAAACVGVDPVRFVVLSPSGKKPGWVRIDGDSEGEESIGLSAVREELTQCGEGTVRWLVQDAMTVGSGDGHSALHGHAHGDDHGHASPLQRLLGLLRAERSDVWVVLVFALVVGVLALATPIAVESLVNTVAFGQFLQPVVILSLILFVLLLFAAGLRALQVYVVEIIQRRMFVRLSSVLAWRFPRICHDACDEVSLREMTNRFFEIATMQKAAATLLLDGVALVLGSLVGMSVLAFYHPWLLGFDLVLLALVAFTVFVLGRGAVPSAIAESRSKYAAAHWFEQMADSPAAFKTPGGRDLSVTRTDRLIAEYLARRSEHFRVVLRQSVFALFLQALASTVLLGLGGWLVINGQLTLGQLVAAELIVTIIVGSFAKLGKHLESYYDLMASLDKVGHLVDLPTERTDGSSLPRKSSAASVRVSGLHYHYEIDSGPPALSDVSFSAPAGSRVAIVGPAGSGKSTLVDLLYGLRAPEGGRIEIDGFPLRDVRLDSLREQVALVRQADIFEGSILENLLMGRTDATAADIETALADVELLHEVRTLPDGQSTRLLESGEPLSTQQAMQLVLARALLGSPRLLLIDGSLDALSDAVQDAIWERLNRRDGMTVVVVTGRDRLIEKCDQAVSLPGAEAPHEPTVAAV